MIMPAVVLGVIASILLLLTGYLIGVKRGAHARELLREQNLSQMQEVLAPLAQREKLAYELRELEVKQGSRGDLTLLLDEMAEKGQFWAVLLSSEEGLPLAASSNAKDLDRLAAISTLSLLFADRLGQDDAPSLLSLMLYDEANKATLCRVFNVNQQRLILTAVSTGADISPTALDPALVKIDAALSS